MLICPICNGLYEYIKYCPSCGNKMEILDRVEDYDDSYSPYLSYEITDLNDGDEHNVCSHICLCERCGKRLVISLNNINE